MIVEIGMGTDLTGADYTKVAVRALRTRLVQPRSSPPLGRPADDMFVR
jgi:hypothetical protein